jgi:hypothetical protein
MKSFAPRRELYCEDPKKNTGHGFSITEITTTTTTTI